ncbi:MAG: hypothetical protein OXE77_08950 [Flavobacteriaceae bacterium]|nr:hypothetical protein [Flavobacteriaceae bacterium]MCY4268513.1 hypothetical protein [Flavobacteriaceae bacterium]
MTEIKKSIALSEKEVENRKKIISDKIKNDRYRVFCYVDGLTKQRIRYLKYTQGKTIANILTDAVSDVELK